MGYSGMLNRVSKLEENGRLSVPTVSIKNFTVSSTLCAFRMIYIYCLSLQRVERHVFDFIYTRLLRRFAQLDTF